MFTGEVNRALIAAADLINTDEGIKSARNETDSLESLNGLKKYLQQRDKHLPWEYSQVPQAQLDRVKKLRDTLRSVWDVAPVQDCEHLEPINDLLDGVGVKLVRTTDAQQTAYRESPIPVNTQLSEQMRATFAAALSHLVVAEETSRLRICRGENCEAAIVDLTRNRSKLFCDFGNCANRAHVRAYRARRAATAQDQPDAAPEKQSKSTSGTGRPVRVKPSAAEKAEELTRPTSASAVAAKTFRDRMRSELMDKRGGTGNARPA